MRKNTIYLVRTKSGKPGKIYNCTDLINNKLIVYLDDDTKMLCDERSLEVIKPIPKKFIRNKNKSIKSTVKKKTNYNKSYTSINPLKRIKKIMKYDLDILKKIIKSFDNKQDLIRVIGNILSLRELGNKLHGDNLEVAVSDLINLKTKYYSHHTGKEFFRSGYDFDILVSYDKKIMDIYLSLMRDLKIKQNRLNVNVLCEKYDVKYTNIKETFNHISYVINNQKNLLKEEVEHISLKCYGKGPLQLSTLSNGHILEKCYEYVPDKTIETEIDLNILNSAPFKNMNNGDVIFAVIYDEKNMIFSIFMTKIYDLFKKVDKIKFIPKSNRGYEKFKFYDNDMNYLFEVRYGKKDANALQRGMWTNTTDKMNTAFEYICYNEKFKIDKEFLKKYRNILIS